VLLNTPGSNGMENECKRYLITAGTFANKLESSVGGFVVPLKFFFSHLLYHSILIPYSDRVATQYAIVSWFEFFSQGKG
jgi:hypothetical protein